MPLFTGFRFGFGRSAAEGGYDSSGPLQASGGNAEYTYNSKKIHVFTASGSLTCTNGSSTCEVFVVGGGGAGANGACGGGGGGGVRNITTPFPVGPGETYTITVGGGGVSPTGTANNGYAGGDSSIVDLAAPTNKVFATGGGAGKYETGPSNPGGGSAGGGHGWDGPGGEAVVSPDGISPTTQGYDGGAGNGWSNGGGGGG